MPQQKKAKKRSNFPQKHWAVLSSLKAHRWQSVTENDPRTYTACSRFIKSFAQSKLIPRGIVRIVITASALQEFTERYVGGTATVGLREVGACLLTKDVTVLAQQHSPTVSEWAQNPGLYSLVTWASFFCISARVIAVMDPERQTRCERRHPVLESSRRRMMAQSLLSFCLVLQTLLLWWQSKQHPAVSRGSA